MLLEEFVVIEALEFVVTILSLEDIELWLEEFELVIGDDALLVVIDEVGVWAAEEVEGSVELWEVKEEDEEEVLDLEEPSATYAPTPTATMITTTTIIMAAAAIALFLRLKFRFNSKKGAVAPGYLCDITASVKLHFLNQIDLFFRSSKKKYSKRATVLSKNAQNVWD